MSDRVCPDCATTVPVLSGYPDWCERCGWNLAPPPLPQAPQGRFERLAERLGRTTGQRLARELLAAPELAPRPTPAKLAAFTIAALVHLFTAVLVIAGALAVVLGFPNPILMLMGAAAVGTGLVMRPRAAGMPEGLLLDPGAMPELHDLARRVAAALERPPPDAIVVSTEFNASWTVAGVRRRRVLTLGLPLLAVLEPRERVAVIAHEIAHDRNGDARRSLLLGSALEALDHLSHLLRRTGERRLGEALGPVELLADAMLWAISRPVDGLLWLEARLLLRDSQRAEYLADELAARTAGTAAMVAAHERLLLASAVALAVQRATTEAAPDVLARVRQAVRDVPERERRRRRRVARLEEARLEATHPPSGMRIELLEGRPPLAPRVELTATESERIDAELAPLEAAAGAELLDHHRGLLYSG